MPLGDQVLHEVPRQELAGLLQTGQGLLENFEAGLHLLLDVLEEHLVQLAEYLQLVNFVLLVQLHAYNQLLQLL